MNKIIILSGFIIGCTLSSCHQEQTQPSEESKLSADFDFTIEGNCNTPNLEVLFENKSNAAKSYQWDFGDGTSSDLKSPQKIYPKAGSYLVKLTAILEEKDIQVQKEIIISRNSDGKGPLAGLHFTRNHPSNLTVDFTIENSGWPYTLHFGDGIKIESTEPVIKYTYSGKGVYSAQLIVKNNEGQNCSSATIDLTH